MKRSSSATVIGSALGLLGLAAVFNPLWQDPEGAARTLENAGYTNIETGGYGWLSCGEGDVWKTRFSATGPTGNQVDGAVCSGFFKGTTIRFD